MSHHAEAPCLDRKHELLRGVVFCAVVAAVPFFIAPAMTEQEGAQRGNLISRARSGEVVQDSV